MPGMSQDKKIPNTPLCAFVNIFFKRIGRHSQRLRGKTSLRSFFAPWGKIRWNGRKDKTGACDASLGSVNMRVGSQCCVVRYFCRG